VWRDSCKETSSLVYGQLKGYDYKTNLDTDPGESYVSLN
jgi:hypothetical protein